MYVVVVIKSGKVVVNTVRDFGKVMVDLVSVVARLLLLSIEGGWKESVTADDEWWVVSVVCDIIRDSVTSL